MEKILLRIEPKQRKEIKRLAKKNNRSESGQIRELLKLGIDQSNK